MFKAIEGLATDIVDTRKTPLSVKISSMFIGFALSVMVHAAFVVGDVS